MDGAAQGGLDHVNSRLQLAQAGFRGQKPLLHRRNLLERQIEPLLRASRLGHAQVAVARQIVQALFKQAGLALDLVSR